MKRLKIGVIGCGGITQMTHLPYLFDLDERYQVVSVCDINQPMAEEVARHFNIPDVSTDYHELVKTGIDAVAITSGGSHRPQILAALQAGKHVFTEKPLCFSPREGAEIDQAVKQSGLKVMVAFMKRYDPGYRCGRKQIQAMQDLRFVQSNVFQSIDAMYREHYRVRAGGGKFISGPIQRPAPGQELQKLRQTVYGDEFGPNITADMGEATPQKRIAYYLMMQSNCHDMNMLRGIFGDPVEVASSEVWNDGLCFSTTLVFKPDIRCNMCWTFLPYLKNYVEEIACYGDHSRIRIQFPAPYLLNAPTPVTIQTEEDGMFVEKKIIVSYEEPFLHELLAFHDWIVEGIEPETTVADALGDIHWLHQAALKFRG